MTSMLVALTETSTVLPWYWGGSVLLIFLILLIATLIIGKGREHT